MSETQCPKTAGLFVVKGEESAGEAVPLKEIHVEVTIVGYVARVESILTYRNELSNPVEAKFTFPMEDSSAVYKFEANIEGRHIVSEIQEREQAQLTYEDAQKHGDVATLLKVDKETSDIFQCMLGNLPPGSSAVLIIGYAVPLAREFDGKLRFTLPVLLNPRYTPEGSLPAGEGANFVSPSEIPYKLNISFNVRGSQKVASLTSEKDQLVVELSEDGMLGQATLAEPFKFDHDLTFLVEYENPFVPQVLVEKGKPSSDGVMKEDMVMINFQPDLKDVQIATCGEFIFLVDRSGSMHGSKMSDTAEALLLFLKSLPPNCYFNVVSFGSSFSSLFSKSKQYTSKTLDDAMALQKNMEADMGGTEILNPLKDILKKSLIPNHPRKIFLLTDGQVSNVPQVISTIKEYSSSTSVYTVGIGDGASTSLCEGAARAGNGKAEFISEGDRLQPKVISLLRESMQPSVRCIEYIWDLPPGVSTISIPEQLPTVVTPGERLTVFAILQNVNPETIYAECSLTVKGQLDGKMVEYTMPFSINDREGESHTEPVFHYLAAKKMIQTLEDGEPDWRYDTYGNICVSEMQIHREKVIAVSKAANVLSRYTSFVAIDKERGTPVEGEKKYCPIPTPTKEFMDFATRPQVMYCMSAPMCEGIQEPKNRQRGMNLFSCFQNQRRKPSAKYSSSPRVCAVENECLESDMDMSEESRSVDVHTLVAKATGGRAGDDKMVKMVSLQCVEGNWEMSDDLAALLSIKKEELDKDELALDKPVLATVAAVAWLRNTYAVRKAEWVIVEAKALSWLQKRLTDSENLESLISAFTEKHLVITVE